MRFIILLLLLSASNISLASIAWGQIGGNWIQEAPPEAPIASPLTTEPALRGADDEAEAQDDVSLDRQAESQDELAE